MSTTLLAYLLGNAALANTFRTVARFLALSLCCGTCQTRVKVHSGSSMDLPRWRRIIAEYARQGWPNLKLERQRMTLGTPK